MLVIRKQRADRAQPSIAIDLAVGARQDQVGEARERRMGQQVTQAVSPTVSPE